MRAARIATVLFAFVISGCCSAPVPPPSCTPPAAPVSVNLTYDVDWLNLDTGTVVSGGGPAARLGWDIVLARNSTRPVQGVIFQNENGAVQKIGRAHV